MALRPDKAGHGCPPNPPPPPATPLSPTARCCYFCQSTKHKKQKKKISGKKKFFEKNKLYLFIGSEQHSILPGAAAKSAEAAGPRGGPARRSNVSVGLARLARPIKQQRGWLIIPLILFIRLLFPLPRAFHDYAPRPEPPTALPRPRPEGSPGGSSGVSQGGSQGSGPAAVPRRRRAAAAARFALDEDADDARIRGSPGLPESLRTTRLPQGYFPLFYARRHPAPRRPRPPSLPSRRNPCVPSPLSLYFSSQLATVHVTAATAAPTARSQQSCRECRRPKRGVEAGGHGEARPSNCCSAASRTVVEAKLGNKEHFLKKKKNYIDLLHACTF